MHMINKTTKRLQVRGKKFRIYYRKEKDSTRFSHLQNYMLEGVFFSFFPFSKCQYNIIQVAQPSRLGKANHPRPRTLAYPSASNEVVVP